MTYLTNLSIILGLTLIAIALTLMEDFVISYRRNHGEPTKQLSIFNRYITFEQSRKGENQPKP
jgi:hypothetical protein